MPFPGTTRAGPWAMLQQRDGTGRVSQTARPFVAPPSWAAGVGDGGSGPGAYRLVTPAVGQSGPAWGVQTCYAGAGRPSQGPPGPAPGQYCNKGTGRAGFLRPPVPLLLSSSWAASVGDGGSGPGAYRLVTPVVGQSGPAWGVQTCYAGGGPVGAGLGRTDLLRRWWASRGRPGAYRPVTPAVGESGPAWGVQTCYAGGGRVGAGLGRTDLLRRRRASRGRPGAYMPVTPAQDALPRDHPGRPLGNASTKGRDGQGFTDRPSLCCAPLLGRRRRGRREWAWGVQTCYAGGGPVGAGLGRTDLLRRRRTPFPGTTRSGPWAILQQRDGTGRVSQTARPFVALLLLGRQRRGRREWAWGVQTCYAGGGPVGAGLGRTCLLRRWGSSGGRRWLTLRGGEALRGRVRGGIATGILRSCGPPLEPDRRRPGPGGWVTIPPGQADRGM